MGIVNSNKQISQTQISCDGTLTVTLALAAAPDIASNPTDIALVLDRSGSMAGVPLENMKIGAKTFIDIIDEATDSSQDGIGPADLHITSLVERVEQEPIREIIFALSATIEGDTTGYYIFKKMKNKEDLVISTIAKGISIGNDLEYTDELTLGRSIVNRVKFSFND